MSPQPSNNAWVTKPTLPQSMPPTPPARDEEVAVMAGERLGSYELLTLLGKGGMGMVFRARHLRLKKEFALKVLSPRLACDQDALRRFERETEAMGRLDDVHLVRASDAGVENGVPYVVMELLEGANLADLTQRRGAWPIAEACEAVRQAALGLQHAFERGLVHRDIKPSNLWLTPDGVVKVLDLGLARLCDDKSNASGMTASGMWMGTPDYIAPEQILDSHTADIRADLYSLGCTLFHLLSGEPPFGPSTHPELRQKSEAHLREPPPNIQQRRWDTPAELAAVVARLLAKRPEDRYQTPAALEAALAPFASPARLPRLLNEGAIPVSPIPSTRSENPSPTQPAIRFSRFARSQRWLVAALLLAALGGLVLFVVSRDRRQPDAPASNSPIVDEKAPAMSREVMPSERTLMVRVWRPMTGYVPLSGALPLRDGDELQMRFRVPAGLHVGLFSVNGRGKLVLLQQYPPREEPAEWIYPSSEKTRQLGPPPGTELLFVCGRSTGPVSEAEMREAWGNADKWPAIDAGRLLRLQASRVNDEGEKPRDFGAMRDRPESDPVVRRLEGLREQLTAKYSYLEGLAFRHE